MKKKIFCLWVLPIFYLVSTVCCVCAEDKIVAIVNKDIITQKDLNEFINFMRMQMSQDENDKASDSRIQEMKPDLVNRLIEDRLILQEARRLLDEAREKKNLPLVKMLEADRNKIKDRIAEMKKRYESDTDFQAALDRQGLTQTDIERRIEEQNMMYTIIDLKIKNSILVNPAEVTDFYNKDPGQFKSAEERSVTAMIIEQPALVNEVFRKVKESSDMPAIAAKYKLKIDKLTFSKGEELKKDIMDAIFGLELGQVSKPVKAGHVIYIFKLDNIVLPKQYSLSEAQDKIYAYLFNVKMRQALDKWIAELKSKAYIKLVKNG